MYHTGCMPPKFYGLPKIIKTGTSLRPIVSGRESVTYGCPYKGVKTISGQMSLLCTSTNGFVNRAKRVTLLLVECLKSYDVTALLTSVPIDPFLNIIKDLLEKDERLQDRTVLSVKNIIELLGFCLYNTYFSFQNKLYEQVEGVTVGSPLSHIVANLYMEHSEREALWSASNPPGIGLGLWITLFSFNNRLINKHS